MNKAMIIRTSVLIVALINQILVMTGMNPLPFENEELEMGLTAVFTVGATLWNWFKNNSVTKEAKDADEYLKEIKELKKLSK
ncbi:SPP1 family holin [Virgibacillus halotolerans]|uniref:phage holin n=1 Tax=Virgibacillus halotolerans TaxID=1071053 RepID=UPI001961FBBC|nr:phage holin [Virgibacillus halotolerans]MBM7598457.1 SPP1 family holin [Virgibacillus halotolerans]